MSYDAPMQNNGDLGEDLELQIVDRMELWNLQCGISRGFMHFFLLSLSRGPPHLSSVPCTFGHVGNAGGLNKNVTSSSCGTELSSALFRRNLRPKSRFSLQR